MAYVGVEFSETGSIGLVHSSWLTPLKHEVFWPPYKTSNSFNKALTLPEELDQNNWKIFAIKRSFFECDDFNKALKKLKKCEDTSDVHSSEPDFENNRKRSRVNRIRRMSECYSTSEDERLTESILKRPPVFPKLPVTSSTSKPGGSSSQPINNLPIENTATRDANVQHLTSVQHLTAVQHLTDANVNANSSEKFFQEIRKLREEVKEIKALLKQSRNSVVAGLPNDIPVEFPLKIIANLQMLENYLNVEEKHNELASYFSSLGGTGTTAQVNRILRFVMTNRLATHYNFAGQRNDKQAFGNTKLKSAIIRAVQIKSPATTQTDVENAIKIWLKHAKQRMQKKSIAHDN